MRPDACALPVVSEIIFRDGNAGKSKSRKVGVLGAFFGPRWGQGGGVGPQMGSGGLGPRWGQGGWAPDGVRGLAPVGSGGLASGGGRGGGLAP